MATTNNVVTLLNKTMLCERLAVSERTLEMMIKRKQFPPAQRIGKRVYWSEVAVQRWQRRLFAAQETWEIE